MPTSSSRTHTHTHRSNFTPNPCSKFQRCTAPNPTPEYPTQPWSAPPFCRKPHQPWQMAVVPIKIKLHLHPSRLRFLRPLTPNNLIKEVFFFFFLICSQSDATASTPLSSQTKALPFPFSTCRLQPSSSTVQILLSCFFISFPPALTCWLTRFVLEMLNHSHRAEPSWELLFCVHRACFRLVMFNFFILFAFSFFVFSSYSKP